MTYDKKNMFIMGLMKQIESKKITLKRKEQQKFISRTKYLQTSFSDYQ